MGEKLSPNVGKWLGTTTLRVGKGAETCSQASSLLGCPVSISQIWEDADVEKPPSTLWENAAAAGSAVDWVEELPTQG